MIGAPCKSACTWGVALVLALPGALALAQVPPSPGAAPDASPSPAPSAADPPPLAVTSTSDDAAQRAQEAAERRRLERMRAEYEAAVPDRAAPEGRDQAPISFYAQMVQMVLMLVAICALAYLLLGKLLPRLLGMTTAGRRAMITTPTQGVLQVVDRLPLDPRRAFMVVRVGEEHFLVGVADQSMSLIARLDDSTFTAEPAAPVGGTKLLGPFARLLERRMDKEGG